MTMRKLTVLIAMVALCWTSGVKAQMPGGVPVTVSGIKQMINGQCFYIHIVQRGQTIYSITKAYGLKEYDAVYRKNARLIDIGDTVWLPCRGLDGKQQNDNKVSASPSSNPLTNMGEVRQSAKHDVAVASRPAKEVEEKNVVPAIPVEPQQPVRTEVATPVANAPEPKVEVSESNAMMSRHLEVHGEIVVSLMMPLYLDQMSGIGTESATYNSSRQPKPFEFVQFYEGMMLALQRLGQQGIRVTLNVVDVPDENPETVEKLFASHNVAQSHLLVALLTRTPFARAAELAKQNQLMVVNPIATRNEILRDNPYVVKCRPSQRSKMITILNTIRATMPSSHLLIIHSGSEKDKSQLSMATKLLDERGDISYSVLNWGNSTNLQATINKYPHTVVLSLYNQSHSRNRIYAGMLLNKLSAYKNNPATLITLDDWTQMFGDIDFNQLQQLTYHTYYEGWCWSDERQQDFISAFRNEYYAMPSMQYAAMGNDIATYFVSGLYEYGSDFWQSPSLQYRQSMVMPMSFIRRDASMGFENQTPHLYRMENFIFVPVR